MTTPTRTVLRTPGAALQAVSGLVGQLTQGAAAIAIVLVVREHTGSVALAGVVAGTLAIGAGVARPIQGRLMDRHGLATLNAVCGVVHPAALIAIVGVSAADGPHALLIVLGVVAGLALPSISTAMRVAWGEAAGDDDRTAAYSMVYLTQELSLLTAPLIFATLTATSSASTGLIVVAVLSGVGTLAFAASVRSVHIPQVASRSRDGRAKVIRTRGIAPVLAAAGAIGAVIGGIEVGVPTLATAHHKPAAAGILIAMLSIGGIVGAAAYGSRQWTADPAARLLSLTSAMTACAAVMVATEGLVVLGLVLLIAGVALNPALTTLTLLLDGLTEERTAAEAFGWLSTGISAGTGAAAAIAGVLVQHGGTARPAFAVAAVAAVGATLLALVLRRPVLRR
ncbi:MAG TPA: MFS transporter [Solirubrobacteraceae bacterium]